MKTAYTVWTWASAEIDHRFVQFAEKKYFFEQALKEIADLGYDGIENFNFIANEYLDTPEEFSSLMQKYGLEFVNLYNYFSTDQKADMKKTESYCKLLNAIGTRQMNIQAQMWFDGTFKPTDYQAIAEYCKRSEEMGALCRQYGIELLMHPHLNTCIVQDNEIEYFLEHTSPENVGLCLDTGHMIPAHEDPVTLFEKYHERLKYVHFKDAIADFYQKEPWPLKHFRELGYGVVDFSGVYDTLVKHGYDGVICVELDRPRICNYDSAKVSREYLKRVIGI